MRSSLLKGLLVGLLGCASGGCFQLDPFLYSPEHLGVYTFDPKGDSALTTVDPGQIEQITLPTEDGLTLGAVYVKSKTSPPRAYVLFFHGNGPALPGNFGFIKRLSNLGYDVLGIDYRGWGTSSDVTPTEEGLEKDSRAALTWLVQRAGSAERIVYYGFSFGGAVATQRAALDPPAVLILESTFASLEEFKTDSSRMDFPIGYVARDRWDTAARIKGIHAPLLILHGLADDYVRPEFAKELYADANEPKELVLVEGANHGEVSAVMGDAYGVKVNGFVDAHLPPQ